MAKFIVEEIFINYGSPRKLVSDQGREFLNNVVKKICQIMDTRKIYTSPYNPKCNGVVERVNQTLIGKLAKLVNQRWNEWDEFLTYALYAYRIIPRNNGVSPFELMNGRKPGKMSQEDIEIEEADGLIVERLNCMREILLREEREIRDKEIQRIKRGRDVEDLEINDYVRRRKLAVNKENKLDNKFEDIFRNSLRIENYTIPT